MTYPARELYDFLSQDTRIVEIYKDAGVPENPSMKIGQLTDKPDTQIAIVDTGGAPYSDRVPVNENRIQILCRSDNYETAMKYLTSLRTRLESLSGFAGTPPDRNDATPGIAKWIGIYVISEPGVFGRDTQNLIRGSLNLRVLRSTTGRFSNKDFPTP